MADPTDLADPSCQTAAELVHRLYGADPKSVSRFTTGAQHFVYDVRLSTDRSVVVRLSRPADLGSATGCLYWSGRLRPLGLPLPEILASDLSRRDCPYPYVILERLPGRDLGDVYAGLTPAQRQDLAHDLAALQTKVGALPKGLGYGFVGHADGPFHYASWADVINAEIDRSRRRIVAARVVDPAHVDQTLAICANHQVQFDKVPPTPFLHDITTKNVIVHQGKLAGIVDVDDLCFGDPMYLPALINIALRAHRRDPVYVREFMAALGATSRDWQAMRVYSVVHCLGFLGELGTRYNRDAPESVDPAYRQHLLTVFRDLTDQV